MKRAVRRRTFVCFGLVPAAGFWVFMLSVMIKGPTGVNGVGALVFGSFIVTLFVVFFWALGWHSAIRFTATHVSVTNVLIITTVAWADVTDVTIAGDGLTIRLRDGKTLGSIQFGGSLIGAFTGYLTHRRAKLVLQDAMKLARQEEAAGTGPVYLVTSVTWRAPLVAAAAIYASLLIALSPHF
jgi:hypothetical protein